MSHRADETQPALTPPSLPTPRADYSPTRDAADVQTRAPRVVVIVLTRDDWANAFECLASLSALTYPNFEIIVVDNASHEPPLADLKQKYPVLTILQNDQNLGYAEGNNIGLRYTLANGAEYVLLLNYDTVVAPDLVTRLVEAAEAQPKAAILGALVYHYDEPRVVQSAGGEMTREWQFSHRGQNVDDIGQYHEVEPVTWVSGCAIMARCAALKQIGLLDAEYFAYQEEIDWCLRARAAGYRVLFVPQAKIWHKGVQRNYQPSPRVTYLSARNELRLLAKHHAGAAPLTRALLRQFRTLTSWSVRPRWRAHKARRNALARALFDFMRGRYGEPPKL